MKYDVLVDLYMLENINCGLGQVSLNLAQQINNHKREDIRWNCLVPGKYDLNLLGQDIELVRASIVKKYLPSSNKDYDLWHSTYQSAKYFPNKNTPYLLTIHDLNFLQEENTSMASKKLHKVQSLVDRAQAITFISKYTMELCKRELDISEEKLLRVIYNGVPVPAAAPASIPEWMPDSKFFFSIGEFKRKKNFHVLIPLLKHFDDYMLVVAGSHDNGEYYKYCRKLARQHGVSDRFISPGLVSEADKSWLFTNCNAFFFPSLAEGFGLPVIEAFHFQKPVFISDKMSLPEVGGDCAYYLENFDESDIADQVMNSLQQFDHDDLIKKKMKDRAMKFNWDNSFGEYLKLYYEILQT